jgi:hypothetical protein
MKERLEMGRLPYLTRIVGSPPVQGPIVKPAHPIMSRWRLASTPEPIKGNDAAGAIVMASAASQPVRPAAPVVVASHRGTGRETTPPPTSVDVPSSPVPDQGVDPMRPPMRARVPPRSAPPRDALEVSPHPAADRGAWNTSLAPPLISPRDPIEPPPLRRGADFDARSPSSERVRPADMYSDSASAPRKHGPKQLDRPHMVDDAPARAREPSTPNIAPVRQNVHLRDVPSAREASSADSRQAPARRAPEFPLSPHPIMLEPRPPAVPPAPPAQPRSRQGGGVRIGSIDIHIQPPSARPQPARRVASPRPAAPLAREFTSPFGLRQG